MKVKKLEWIKSISDLYLESSSNQYIIFFPVFEKSKNFVVKLRSWGGFKGEKVIGEFETLEQAQKACQDHYEAFILSQIENEVKAFDPTLLGFKEIEPEESMHKYWNYKIDHLYIREFIYKYKRKKIKSLMKLYKGTIKNKVMWQLYRNNERTELAWQVPKFDPIEIPNHDFGVTLISQFLGVE